MVCLLVVCGFVQVRSARAAYSVSYKFADYSEDDDRMQVETHYGLVDVELGTDMRLKLIGVIDTLAGATPTGEPPDVANGPVPLAQISDRRKAWSADFSRQFPRVNATVGFANSRESDYVSNGWSVNGQFDFNQKNTLFLVGIAATDDDIRVFYQTDWATKRTRDVIVGVTQLLDPLTSVTFNVSHGRSTGFHADPYRLIEKITEIAPGVFLPRTFNENRPDAREKWIAYASINRALPRAAAAVEASYRWFDDSFGTTAHTVELAWFQKLGERLVLRPTYRFYDQTQADFYRRDLTGTNIDPTSQPMPTGPFFSADYRLSAFRAHTVGLKAIWDVTAQCQLDVAYEHYEMRARDGRTSPHMYPTASIVSVGVKFSW
jgi:hypothetical protein